MTRFEKYLCFFTTSLSVNGNQCPILLRLDPAFGLRPRYRRVYRSKKEVRRLIFPTGEVGPRLLSVTAGVWRLPYQGRLSLT